MTIPNLMTKYQQHVFENQFKKSLYTISQIVARTRSELGVSRLGEYCAEYDVDRWYYNANTCVNVIKQYIFKDNTKKQTFNNDYGYAYNILRNINEIKTYNNTNSFNYNDASIRSIQYTNQMPDGSFLGFNVNNHVLHFGVDLNGIKKPNRLGYDIFIFSLNNKNDTISGFLNKIPNNNISDEDVVNAYNGATCSLTSATGMNGLGCAYYALHNKCPYDDTKTYWECLK